MACCLAAPSHYMTQYWLLVNKVLWYLPERNVLKLLLSHPGLGWLYVFSSFTSPWPWPKVTAVASISKKNACLYDKVRTTHPITTKHGSFIALVMVITILDFAEVLLETVILANVLFKNLDVFFQGQTLCWPYLRNGCSDWCEMKKEVYPLDAVQWVK